MRLIAGWALLALGLALSRAAVIKERATKTPWELLDALTATSQIRSFNGTWITDSEFYYTASDKSIHKYDAITNTDSIFVSSDFLAAYNTSSTFTLSPDNKRILVRFDVEQVFRHSRIAKYDIFDIESGTSISIKNGDKLQYCTWSPSQDRLSFVYENNVYVHFGENVETRITYDGVDGVIYNGIPDWVYEEEVLSSGDAMWWSPDAAKLAVGMFNDTQVQTFKYYLYGEAEDPEYQYPHEVDLKYPKPGTTNPMVNLRIYNLKSLEAVDIPAPVAVVTEDHILQNVAWPDSDHVLVTWMNRRQNIASMQLCSMDGVCREVKRFNEPEGWVVMSTPICLAGGNNCLFTHWIGDWYQMWNLNLQTGQNLWTSRGDFTVLRIYGYDTTNDKVYYQATLKGDPSVYHVFANDDCLTCKLQDVEGEFCRSASASFSTGFSYYTVICSGPNPSYTKIFETKTNTEVKDWESNAAFRATLETKLRPTVRFLNVTLADGSMGYAKVQLPPNLDESKRYPMIVYVYGGPNSVRTTNGFVVGFDAYMTTNREVIYAQIDGRGTGNKGKKLLFSVNNNLGEHEIEDQIYVTKQLQAQFSFIDRDRTGIWGWSYGGYVSAKTLSKDSERIFQCGISVAPVTSWLYYDSIYTERFMGLPTAQDNLQKYYDSDVLRELDNFRSHDFLLIHGSGDDNVHYQQSLMLAKELQTKDILFEQMTYTDENHSIGNFLPHLYNTMDHFWINCLNLDVDEED